MTRNEMKARRRAALMRRFGGEFRTAADDFDLDELLGADEVLEDEFGDEFDPEALPVLDDETGMIDEETGECVCKDEDEAEEAAEDEAEEAAEDEAEEAAEEEEEEGRGETASNVEGLPAGSAADASDETPPEEETTEAATETTDVMWAPLMSETALASIDDAEVNSVTLLYDGSDEADPFYAMSVNARPLCEIHANDLQLDEQALAMFSSDDFTNGVKSHIASQGVKRTLAGLSPRYYAARTTTTAEADRAKTEVKADYEKAYQSRVAETKNRIMNLFSLAFEAGRKNFIVENPLRDAMRIAFRKVGVNDAQAVELFEAAMEQAGPAFLKNAQKHVDEWLGMDPEALEQLKKAITGAAYANPTDRGLQVIPEQIPEAPQAQPIPQPQVPRHQANTASAHDDSWDMDEALVRGSLSTMTKPRS